MRRWINWGAGFLAVFFPLTFIAGLINNLRSNEPVDPVVATVWVILAIGYFSLMKVLGAWNEEAWDDMGGGRKTILFLLAFPGMILVIGSVIGLISFLVFLSAVPAAAKDAVKIGSDAAGPLVPAPPDVAHVYEAGFGATEVCLPDAFNTQPVWRVRFVSSWTPGAIPVHEVRTGTPEAKPIRKVR